MNRARRWTVVLLVVLTGIVAGFARLDGEGSEPARAVGPAPPPEDDGAADAARTMSCFRQFAQFLEENGNGPAGQGSAVPPLDQLPPLPRELLPPERASAG